MNKKMILRSMRIWLGIIPLAMLNGVLREAMLSPALGYIALPISGILLSTMVFLLTFIFIPRLGKGTPSTYVKIGFVWIIATVLFEFTLGFATGESLENMLTAYNIFSGNLWLFVIIFIGFTPWLTAKVKKII